MRVSQLRPDSSPAGRESVQVHGWSNVNVLWMPQALTILRGWNTGLCFSKASADFNRLTGPTRKFEWKIRDGIGL